MIWDNVVYFKNDIKGEKQEAIKVLASGANIDNSLLKRVLERENEYSSAVGKGVSFIGIKEPVEKPVIIIGISKEGIDFNAFDGIPVKIIIVFIGGEDTEKYVEIVSLILSLVNQITVRKSIISAHSQQELISIIKKEELNE